MQRNCRFEIISVSREENSLPCSTEWDKSVYFTPSNLLPKSVVKMKHLTREQRYGISLMLQEGKNRKDMAKAIGVSTSTISRELRKNCDMRNGTYNYDLAQRKYETRLKLRGRKPVFTKEMKDTVVSLLEEGYSPEQIKGRSNVEGFAMVSHETMYRWIWEDKLSGKDAVPLALKTIEALQPIKDLIHTITADNGKEFAKHQEIAEKLEISFYFCKPYHSWERGANENMNGLIRQYIPKGTDFSGITDEFVSWVENKLNNRPRKRLGYLTPNEKFNSILTN